MYMSPYELNQERCRRYTQNGHKYWETSHLQLPIPIDLKYYKDKNVHVTYCN